MLALLTLGFIFVVLPLLSGFVLNILWGWYVVPKFQLPPLGIVEAIGISLLVSVMTNQYVPSTEEDEGEHFRKLVGHEIALPVAALILGWVFHFFL